MKEILDRINKLRELSDRIEYNANLLGEFAARGMAPNARLLDELQTYGANIVQQRAELDELMQQTIDPECDFSKLTLEQLAARVEQHTRGRRCSEAYARIADAAALFRSVGEPAGLSPSADELAARASEALAAGDTDGVLELEQLAALHIGMAALLRDGDSALIRDEQLVRRMEEMNPQLMWYIRARARLNGMRVVRGTVADELPELGMDCAAEAAAVEPAHGCTSAGNGCRYCHRPDPDEPDGTAPAPICITRPAPDTAPVRSGRKPRRKASAAKYGSGLRDSAPQCAPVSAFPDIPDDEVERLRHARTDEQTMGRSGRTRRAAAAACAAAAGRIELVRQKEEAAAPQPGSCMSGELKGLICDAQRFLRGCERTRPVRGGIQQAVWDRLLGPDEGLVYRVIAAIRDNDAARYGLVWELYDKVMIPGTANGLQANMLFALICSIWAEEGQRMGKEQSAPTPAALTQWLRTLSPALLLLGRWGALAERSGKRIHPGLLAAE